MNSSHIKGFVALVASLGSTAHAIDSGIYSGVVSVYDNNKQKTFFSCGYGSYGYTGPDRLNYRQAEEKSLNELKAKYPSYPWSDIVSVVEELESADLAISMGTSCTEYIYAVKASTMAKVASNVGECKVAVELVENINLKSCLKKLACQSIGQQSTACN